MLPTLALLCSLTTDSAAAKPGPDPGLDMLLLDVGREGDPHRVRMKLKNMGAEVIYYCPYRPGFSFTDPKGRPVHLPEKPIYFANAVPGYSELKPGESRSHDERPTDLYDIPPGRYRIRAVLPYSIRGGASGLEVVSRNEVTLVVPAPGRPEAR